MCSIQYQISLTLIFILNGISVSFTQNEIKDINKLITHQNVYRDMMYLASDDLRGRKTGEAGNQLAAKYIADQLGKAGVKHVQGMNDFFQVIPFVKYAPAKEGKLTINSIPFEINNNMVILDVGETNISDADAIYVDFGWIDTATGTDDYKDLDIRGKYVIAQGGPPTGGSPLEIFASMPKKRAMAKSKGALGLIELYNMGFNWGFFRNYFSKERLEVSNEVVGSARLFNSWIQVPTLNEALKFTRGTTFKINLHTTGARTEDVNAVNVIGVIPGKKKELKDQFEMISAHFDHIGVNAGQRIGNDSIWNGARDNAWGTICLINAARYLTRHPADRSILIAAVNGEEIGLLGSKYLADHPVVPWNKVIFDLNSDGAGYSDTTLVSIIGLNRVGAADEMKRACVSFGLSTNGDPAPEQGLFDRSDNVNFAQLGIPSPTFASGFTSFDAAVGKYYHQAIDNPDNISYGYLLKFCRAFTLSAVNIANRISNPRWIPGDKYEPAGKKLYGY